MKEHVDKYIFYVCLAFSLCMFIGGFFCPPMGVMKAGGILLGFATLAVAGQNLANGKDVTFSHGDTEVTIGDDEDGKGDI